MKIQFCGAATGVTGSCHLVSTDKYKVLLDCGQFQGGDDPDAANRAGFPFNPAEIDCVVLTHAHIDHCGRLPVLIKRGFKGPIYCTDATADLLDVMLKDAAHICEQDAERDNRKNQRAGRTLVEPLFDTNDALATLTHVDPCIYDTLIVLNEQMKVVFNDAGHILGSAIVELWVEEGERTSKLVFSGDIGMGGRPIINNPTKIKKADYLIMESTYGNRMHEPSRESVEKLLQIIYATTKNGGNVVIPSFAVGRTQELLYELNKVYDGKTEYTEKLKNVPVYVDSPMAVDATEVFRANAQAYNQEMKDYILSGDHPLDFRGLHYARTSEESQRINVDMVPKVIISASGMCDAGRIRHHLKHNLWNEKCAVVFVGYQAEGTLGRTLLDGAKEVKLFGEAIAVNAQIYNLQGFSGHADQGGLFDWLCGFQKMPQKIFLVHGEKEAKEDFAKFVRSRLGWDCTVIDRVCEYELGENESVTAFDTAEEEFAGQESVQEIRDRLKNALSDVSDVIDNAEAATDKKLTEDELVALKNRIAALEKEIINLGATVSK